MSDKSAIQWTEATKQCSTCRQVKLVTEFARDKSRADGLTYRCRDCRNTRSRTGYVPKPRPAAGRRFVAARDGDKAQARRRIDHLIAVGLLSDPNDVPCVDCGHEWTTGGRRHEYDHHLGYAAEHHESVEPLCTRCHHRREDARREVA